MCLGFQGDSPAEERTWRKVEELKQRPGITLRQAVQELAELPLAERGIAAIGISDETWGERPLVLVVPHPGRESEITEEAVLAHIQSHVDRGELSRWALPDRIEVVGSIDKTSVGKIDKKRLRARYSPAQ